eukprot:TRINITY_DN68841_c0_g1_i1.p1 TRINITY_DN68841_c0_g1~~TRINITY_DN68841_c0_g1_i1.p1  ORF type:complete len:158 (+),score=31.67 TRINITY_DN68841_c0_g1_i1:55-474(+)
MRTPLWPQALSGQVLAPTRASSGRRWSFVGAALEDEEGDPTEGFWRRRWRRVKKRRAKMHHQIEAAHDQMRAFYDLGHQRLIARGRLSPEEAARFARIDERLFELQRKPGQLEFYDRRKQFHEEWVQKHFSLRKSDDDE